ncbi:MAG: DUF72 domain-containing protein [Verrucomicrobiota bacterium]
MSSQEGTVRIGTSGYQYDHWRGAFYPDAMAKTQWFDYYARIFDTVEINNTFYNLPETETFRSWRAQAPRGFLYTLKFSRYGSHIKRLKDGREIIGNFLAPTEELGDRLGPILVQLPPNWKPNVERLATFLEAVGGTSHRWAMEFRDPRWLIDDVFDELRKHNVALVFHDMIDEHPREITADWIYLRYHGDDYAGSYTSEQLAQDAEQIRTWSRRGLDVFAYFNNDAEACAPANARELREKINA